MFFLVDLRKIIVMMERLNEMIIVGEKASHGEVRNKWIEL